MKKEELRLWLHSASSFNLLHCNSVLVWNLRNFRHVWIQVISYRSSFSLVLSSTVTKQPNYKYEKSSFLNSFSFVLIIKKCIFHHIWLECFVDYFLCTTQGDYYCRHTNYRISRLYYSILINRWQEYHWMYEKLQRRDE